MRFNVPSDSLVANILVEGDTGSWWSVETVKVTLFDSVGNSYDCDDIDFTNSRGYYFIEYSACNGGTGYAASTIELEFVRPEGKEGQAFRVCKIGVFGVDST